MDRKKVIYIGLLLILTVIASITYFSYAFFTKTDEQHGKLNVVVGTLSYELKSSDLTNNSITLSSKEKKLITIKLKSLNNIASDYKLYYTSSNSNFDIGYSSTTVDATSGTINANGEKTILISIENKNNSSITINFGVVGGFVGKTLALNSGQTFIGTEFDFSACNYSANYVWNFPYNGNNGMNGSVQNFTVPCDGNYKLEVWGAQGGNSSQYTGGKGGYSIGNIALTSSDSLFIYAGGQGVATSTNNTTSNGGFNGGGFSVAAGSVVGASGGGASDIRIGTDSLYARVIVAGGGGGAGQNSNNGNGFVGGGTSGGGSSIGSSSSISSSSSYNTSGGGPGTQTAGGNSYQYSGYDAGTTAGTFGVGGGHVATHTSNTTGGGGGSGWYGGGGAAHSAGGGGSGYVYTSSTASNYPSGCQLNSSYYLTNAETKDGNTSFPAPSGGNETGHSGNGYVRITYLGS